MNKGVMIVRGATHAKDVCLIHLRMGYSVLILESQRNADEVDRFCQEVNMTHPYKNIMDYIATSDDIDAEEVWSSWIKHYEQYVDVVYEKIIYHSAENGSEGIELYPTRNFPFEYQDDTPLQQYVNTLAKKHAYDIIDQRKINEIKNELKRYLIYRENQGTAITHNGNIVNNFHISIESYEKTGPTGKLILIPETL